MRNLLPALGLSIGLCVWPVCPAIAQFPAEVINTEAPSTCRVGLRVYETERGNQVLGELYHEDITKLLPGWDAEFALYEPVAEYIDKLAAIDQHVDIICVLGTWCGDSEREVPRFWKILDLAGNPNLELTMFAVGRTSDARADEILTEIGFDQNLRKQYGVELVPTFVFFMDGWEVGRIIETPKTSLEQDMVELMIDEESEQEPSWH